MQKIFYNAKIYTFDGANTICEAMLVNDESVVFVGSTDEVLSMKTEDTLLFNLGGKTVFPSFFSMNTSIYNLIENNLKNANLDKYLENNAEIDTNYDKFVNFKKYRAEFLKIQENFVSKGITTVLENNLSSKSFTFFKKLAEEKVLKLDIVGFVDIINFKMVMDDNCRSYRKFKNHFRLGGYTLSLDGGLLQKKAWLTKAYPHEGRYRGCGNLTDENLSILIKSALDEKKQFVVSASGDEAVSQFVRCFEEKIKDKSEEELFRPLLMNCYVLSKNQLKSLKQNHISPAFNISEHSKNLKHFKHILGTLRSKTVMRIKTVEKIGLKYLLSDGEEEILNSLELANLFRNKNLYSQNDSKSNFIKILKQIIVDSAYFAFDEVHKGSLENGKHANFVVLENFDENNPSLSQISQTYFYGENISNKKKKD